jgi:hypothetical protein
MKKRFTHSGKTIASKTTSICFTADNSVNVHNLKTWRGVWPAPQRRLETGALGAYLVHHASASSALRRAMEVTQPITYIVSEQGAEINRPSTLYVELALSPVEGVNSAGEEITTVRVGG